MNKYLYDSEEEANLMEVNYIISNFGDDLVEYYLKHGLKKLLKDLSLFSENQKQILFDYLMLERKALLKCIQGNKGFFLKIIIEGKGETIRPMLGIADHKYDKLWLEAIDLLSLYFAEKKVAEKFDNLKLDQFLQKNILKSGIKNRENLEIQNEE